MSKSEKQKAQQYEPMARTSIGCRDALFDALDGLRSGTMTPTLANATAKVIGEIVNTVQLELNVAKFVQHGSKQTPKLGALTLGEK
jgi:hypothetical protein